MDHDCFIIFRSDDGWTLQWNGRDLSSFGDLSEAVRAAHAAARMSRARGRAVEIVTRTGQEIRTGVPAAELHGG
jgi:hypothetical protein